MNRCEYCAIQTAFVNAMMLHLEAELGTPPSVLAILGTRSATSDPKPFYLGRKKVMLALRQPYGRQVEYSSLVEFTTGKAARSGGLRRPHWNLFLKGLPLAELDQVRELVRAIWCKHVDAEPEAQYVEELRDPGAAANYVALHFQKEGQAPPAGWTGQRFNSSRGFFDGRSRAEMRELAELEMKRRRLGWLLSQVFAGDVEDLVQAQLLDQAGTEWELVKTSPRRAELLLAMDPATGEILKRGCLTRPDAAS